MKPCTGAQLTMLQALRKETGLKPLTNYQVKCLTINSASTMIEDLQVLRDTLKAMKESAEA